MKKLIYILFVLFLAMDLYASDGSFVQVKLSNEFSETENELVDKFDVFVFDVSEDNQNQFYEQFILDTTKQIKDLSSLEDRLKFSKKIGDYLKSICLKYESIINQLELHYASVIQEKTIQIMQKSYMESEMDDFTGEPSKEAIELRQKQVDEFAVKVELQKNEDIQHINEVYHSLIQKYFDLYLTSISTLENADLELSSIKSKFSVRSVSYDGNLCCWILSIASDMFGDLENLEIPYEVLTGCKPVKNAKDLGFEEYNQITLEYTNQLKDFDANYNLIGNMAILTDVDFGKYNRILYPNLHLVELGTGRSIELSYKQQESTSIVLSDFALNNFKNYEWLQETVQVSKEKRKLHKTEQKIQKFNDFKNNLFWDIAIQCNAAMRMASDNVIDLDFKDRVSLNISGTALYKISPKSFLGVEGGLVIDFYKKTTVTPAFYLNYSWDPEQINVPMINFKAGYSGKGFDIWGGIKAFYVLGVGYKTNSGFYGTLGFDISLELFKGLCK